MRAAQTIWRLSSVGCWFVLTSGCDFGSKPPPPPDTRNSTSRLQLPSAAPLEAARETPDASPAAAAVAQTLRLVHEQRLQITAPSSSLARLALGGGRLLQASTNKVVLRNARSGDVISETPIDAVSALGQGADGSLFALGLSGSVRFLPYKNAPNSFPHVTFFPGSALFPDLEDPAHFFVHYPSDQQLLRYSFEAEGGVVLPIEAQFQLPGCTAAVSLLRDGAFVCGSATSIIRKAPRGAKTEFKLPPGVSEPLRLLPAKRLDELYAVSRAGEVVHLRLAAGTPVLARFQLPAPPFAALASSEALAFVVVSPPDPGQPRHWTLLVTDLDGQPRFHADLPEPSVSPADDWLQEVTADKNLAISWAEPLVAVGGAEHLRVWDYAQGRQLFTL